MLGGSEFRLRNSSPLRGCEFMAHKRRRPEGRVWVLLQGPYLDGALEKRFCHIAASVTSLAAAFSKYCCSFCRGSFPIKTLLEMTLEESGQHPALAAQMKRKALISRLAALLWN